MATKKRAAAGGDDNNKKQLLKNLLQQAIDSGDPDLIELATQAIAKQGGPTKRGRPSKKPVKDNKKRSGPAEFTGNTFNPDDYANQFTQDTIEIDKKIKFKVSARREAAEDVEVKCSLCQRINYIPASEAQFLTDSRYYICNQHKGS